MDEQNREAGSRKNFRKKILFVTESRLRHDERSAKWRGGVTQENLKNKKEVIAMMREYRTLTALRNGEVVSIKGSLFKMAEGKIQPGDT